MSFSHDIRICVPLNEKTLSALAAATVKAAGIADLIELRADGLEPEQLDDPAQLQALIKRSSQPIVLTFRATEEGGYRSLTRAQRRAFWDEHLQTDTPLFDIEFDLVAELTTRDGSVQPDWSRVICSHHNFNETPTNLTSVYEKLAFTPARIIKLAVQANDIVDCLEVFKLLERSSREQRDVIAIAMGDAGVITRILGPARGAFLTYGACELEKGTAPGQILASELKSVYRIDRIDSETMITGLVGSPVMHSVSPHMHNAAFRASGINGVYLPLEVCDLESFITRMVNPGTRELDWNLKGLSITAPHKVEVMKYLDWIDPVAHRIGAVNTVVLDNERLLGYNTDAEGFLAPLIQRLGSLSGVSAAVIGAGGAASAAVFALQQQGADVIVYARNPEKAKSISHRFKISCELLDNVTFAGKDVVVNATPLGSFGKSANETPVSALQLHGCRLVYDLIYNPVETQFIREGREAGCEVLGGLEMLVAQARLQFKLMTDIDVSYELMYAAGLSALTRNSPSRS